MDYRNKAIKCVKDTVLLEQKRQFEECGCNLDEQYMRYGDTEALFAKIINLEYYVALLKRSLPLSDVMKYLMGGGSSAEIAERMLKAAKEDAICL